MPSNLCPRCHRKTYSAKFNSCTAAGCALNKATGFEPTLVRPTRYPVLNDTPPVTTALYRNVTAGPTVTRVLADAGFPVTLTTEPSRPTDGPRVAFAFTPEKHGNRYVPVEERFWAKVDTSGECWLWTSRVHRTGYGTFWDGAKTVTAHRWAYEFEHGPLNAGFDVMHSCDTPLCVRGDHLAAGSRAENNADMRAKGRLVTAPAATARRAITHCPRGHEFTTENTFQRATGWRECRTCRNDLQRARRQNPSEERMGDRPKRTNAERQRDYRQRKKAGAA